MAFVGPRKYEKLAAGNLPQWGVSAWRDWEAGAAVEEAETHLRLQGMMPGSAGTSQVR